VNVLNEIRRKFNEMFWFSSRILTVDTADDFYSIMGVLAREILEFGLMEPNRLVQVTC
jgi:hypothetical protein